jgi:hypothetical protein
MPVFCDPDSGRCFYISLDDTMTIESAAAFQQGQTLPVSMSHVPLGEGPPTKEELLVHYPAKFTWMQLKTFVNSG